VGTEPVGRTGRAGPTEFTSVAPGPARLRPSR